MNDQKSCHNDKYCFGRNTEQFICRSICEVSGNIDTILEHFPSVCPRENLYPASILMRPESQVTLILRPLSIQI